MTWKNKLGSNYWDLAQPTGIQYNQLGFSKTQWDLVKPVGLRMVKPASDAPFGASNALDRLTTNLGRGRIKFESSVGSLRCPRRALSTFWGLVGTALEVLIRACDIPGQHSTNLGISGTSLESYLETNFEALIEPICHSVP